MQLINGIQFFRKMRKSLNNKRNEITAEFIEDLTQIYGEFKDGITRKFTMDGKEDTFVVSKVFDNADFGYRQITIERPLRLNFRASAERITKLHEISTFENLANSKKKDKKQAAAEEKAGREQQEVILAVLHTMDPTRLYKSRDEFVTVLEKVFEKSKTKLSVPIRKMILSALSEQDETADILFAPSGAVEADSELRDHENVPLKENIRAYFDREVRPHVEDAWINEEKKDEKDETVGIIGYEIPVTRHFYKYVPPLPLEKIEAEIAGLEKDIVHMLREVVG